MTFFDQQTQRIIDALHGMLFGGEHWVKRWDIARYIDRCIGAGFCKTDNDIRLCAQRYIDGKRAVTPPGTKLRKKQAKERKALRANVPVELTAAVTEVISANEKAVTQFKGGNEKAINALMGQVIRKYKADAAFIKELLVEAIQGQT